MVTAKEQAGPSARRPAQTRRAALAKVLGLALALVWIGVLVWLGIVLVRLKLAGPEALRTNEPATQSAPATGTTQPDAGMPSD